MTQYFVNPEGPAKYHQLHATIWGHDYEFRSSNGVFSQYRLDLGTSVLLRTLDPPADRPARFLDLGCGFGPIAVALATECPRARVDAIDVNERAVELTAMNAKALGTVHLAQRHHLWRPELHHLHHPAGHPGRMRRRPG